eukprot:CAMPEP_0184987092 /NCGR_PEP_ID=MMETSP1098-20130426/18974_1 /TAXON_ID=89044 /ORGANISM="Spumella elongata, Strain CCAP 955/1" /LENGTH=42 /DNA_ID= /DNA_START= /DNA_END= /DNA_ORIENTATION=
MTGLFLAQGLDAGAAAAGAAGFAATGAGALMPNAAWRPAVAL